MTEARFVIASGSEESFLRLTIQNTDHEQREQAFFLRHDGIMMIKRITSMPLRFF